MAGIPLIAVIDDDAGMRRSLGGLVRSIGYREASFESAEAFLEVAGAIEADCVICDVHMSEMDGLSLARNVGARLRGRIILMSALASERMQAEAHEAGVRFLLRKPFDGEELIGCIEDIVNIAR